VLTRIEIDGFKSFQDFKLNLRPLTAVVGPNASGKSNLFDAIRFISLISQYDVRTAMQDLRGRPEELFRQTGSGTAKIMRFAVETFLPPSGIDAFGARYEVKAQRLRYEISLQMSESSDGLMSGATVIHERCYPIAKADDEALYLKGAKISYNSGISPFIRVGEDGQSLEIRQDGRQKHGKPVRLSLPAASRSALSTISTSEFPHLYALRDYLSGISFLEIDPKAARKANDLFEERTLRPDASNLSAVLARLLEETATPARPDGVLADVAADLTALIPSVSRVKVGADRTDRQYSFKIEFKDQLSFSSRVISDGTLRLLALLTVLNDPLRKGTLCFEEPENGVHEGRIPFLIDILRDAAKIHASAEDHPFQIILNTHSPVVMSYLHDVEIVAADAVHEIEPDKKLKINRTRMRTGIVAALDVFDPEKNLTRAEVESLLRRVSDGA
jgi:predicted ATPase